MVEELAVAVVRWTIARVYRFGHGFAFSILQFRKHARLVLTQFEIGERYGLAGNRSPGDENHARGATATANLEALRLASRWTAEL